MDRPAVAVAYSAGRDSTALLHATLHAAARLGGEVLALHVHHGLNAQADAWLQHAREQCERWARDGLPVRFNARRLEGRPARGDSIEAWARQARYAALAEMAREGGATLVLLAHHLRDQAETWLLQALRGAGAAGLASMPASIEREGLTWARPWLGRSRESIEAYVELHRLEHVDDDSNGDPRFGRNRLRLQVWPALTRAFPDAEASLAQAATWAQQACECLEELAELDLATVTSATGALELASWLQLGHARRTNALRAWLHLTVGRAVPASLILRLHDEVGGGHQVARWPAPGGTLRRHRGHLSFVAGEAVRAVPGAADRETSLSIRRAGLHALPGWNGVLEARRVKEGGVPLAWMAHLELRPRQGGERFQAGFERPARSLKKQYQAAGVPSWERDGPLVYSGGQLLFVPGLGIDARVIGLPGQAQMLLRWIQSPDPGGPPGDASANR